MRIYIPLVISLLLLAACLTCWYSTVIPVDGCAYVREGDLFVEVKTRAGAEVFVEAGDLHFDSKIAGSTGEVTWSTQDICGVLSIPDEVTVTVRYESKERKVTYFVAKPLVTTNY